MGYVPAARVAVAVVTNYAASAYTDDGNKTEASLIIFSAIATVMTPGTPPGFRP